MMMIKKTRMLIIVIVSFLVAGLIFMNPYDVLTRRSDRFSLNLFESVQIGQPIETAIKTLGKPISIEESINCDECKIYYFMGKYPNWVFGGTECWYLVDEGGLIIERVIVEEP